MVKERSDSQQLTPDLHMATMTHATACMNIRTNMDQSMQLNNSWNGKDGCSGVLKMLGKSTARAALAWGLPMCQTRAESFTVLALSKVKEIS